MCAVLGCARARPGAPLGLRHARSAGGVVPAFRRGIVPQSAGTSKGGLGCWREAQTREPARSREVSPCAVRQAMHSEARAQHSEQQAADDLRRGTSVFQSRTEPSGTSLARTSAKSRCHIWLWTRLMRGSSKPAMGAKHASICSRAAAFPDFLPALQACR